VKQCPICGTRDADQARCCTRCGGTWADDGAFVPTADCGYRPADGALVDVADRLVEVVPDRVAHCGERTDLPDYRVRLAIGLVVFAGMFAFALQKGEVAAVVLVGSLLVLTLSLFVASYWPDSSGVSTVCTALAAVSLAAFGGAAWIAMDSPVLAVPVFCGALVAAALAYLGRRHPDALGARLHLRRRRPRQ
jgi:hypothetical protein